MRLKDLLQKKKRNLLNIYFTAGYPHLNDTSVILSSLEQAGVDMVEIGIPYSDPLSDGPTIQQSNQIAINNGITLDLIFDQLEKTEADICKIMMGYFNSIYQYGIEKFCDRAKDVGISGVILPDLPLDLFDSQYRTYFEKADLSFIPLITPQTSNERLKKIDGLTDGFIYAVSSSSTTGQDKNIQSSEAYLKYLATQNLSNPFLVGFNIRTSIDVQFVNQYANGSIIGSAFIKMLSQSNNIEQDIREFIQKLQQDKVIMSD